MTGAATQIQSSTPRLSEVARHLVFPPAIVKSGWPRIKARLADMAVEFDPWQETAASLILGKDKHDRYACTVGGVVWSIPRQVGKTFTIGSLLIAMCIEFPGFKVIWTAHHTRTSTDAFRAIQGMVRRPKVAPHLAMTARSDGIRSANGEQEIRFRNGSLMMFGAREQGFGRGFSAVDVEVFDEAQILRLKALEDMVAATNQARHPHGALLFFLGTPPRPADPGEAFTAKRDQALSGEADDMLYLELSADPDSDPDDRAQWPVMNPSFPKRTPLESMLRLRKNLPDEDAWNREARGVWDPVRGLWVIPREFWESAGDLQSVAVDRLAIGIEAGPDLSWASVALAGQRSDGDWHVELWERKEGAAWVAPLVRQILDQNPGKVRAVVADAGSPTAALFDDLSRLKVKLTKPKVVELGTACSRLLDGIVTGSVRHTKQGQMDAAVAVAGKRPLGDTGMWVWSRKTSTADITPIQSATLALFGAQNVAVKRPGSGRTSGREAVVM